MGLASATNYVKDLLNGLAWPAGMQALTNPPPPLIAQVMPIDPYVLAGTPQAQVWFAHGDESRGNDKYRAGTVPRALTMGGPSGTKTIIHRIAVYLVWTGGSPTDPVRDTLFPGMVDWVMATLRVTTDPQAVPDPWTPSITTDLVDIGETMSFDTALRTLEEQQAQRLDALITLTVTEIMSA